MFTIFASPLNVPVNISRWITVQTSRYLTHVLRSLQLSQPLRMSRAAAAAFKHTISSRYLLWHMQRLSGHFSAIFSQPFPVHFKPFISSLYLDDFFQDLVHLFSSTIRSILAVSDDLFLAPPGTRQMLPCPLSDVSETLLAGPMPTLSGISGTSWSFQVIICPFRTTCEGPGRRPRHLAIWKTFPDP